MKRLLTLALSVALVFSFASCSFFTGEGEKPTGTSFAQSTTAPPSAASNPESTNKASEVPPPPATPTEIVYEDYADVFELFKKITLRGEPITVPCTLKDLGKGYSINTKFYELQDDSDIEKERGYELLTCLLEDKKGQEICQIQTHGYEELGAENCIIFTFSEFSNAGDPESDLWVGEIKVGSTYNDVITDLGTPREMTVSPNYVTLAYGIPEYDDPRILIAFEVRDGGVGAVAALYIQNLPLDKR